MTDLRALLVACLAGLALTATAQAAPLMEPAQTPTRTPIKHFITLMQENHSFDNYFGTYPGADGTPPGVCMPRRHNNPKAGCVKPFRIGDRAIVDLGHSTEVFDGQYNGGRLDGFVSTYQGQGTDGALAMGYYDDEDLPYYWNIADNFTLFDRFFTSAAAGSVWNHMYWVSATPGNTRLDEIPEQGFGDIPTIFDRLQRRGISWKFYVQNYDPNITYRSRVTGDKGAQVVWNPLLAYARYLDDPELNSRIVDLDEYFDDVENGTLPAVSYIVPSGASEHPPGSVQAGERFVRTLINSLMRSSSWSSSAFMWTYDDWGGWYDHVKPPKVDPYGYGFRAPALIVSPYSKRGHIEHTQTDFTSMIKFITYNWRLEHLARRDRIAGSILGAFDFEAPPRSAAIIPAERPSPPPAPQKRWVIYVAYAFSALVAAAALSTALARSRRSLRIRIRRDEA